MFFEVFKKYPNVLVHFSEKSDGSMKLLENILPDHPNLQNRKNYLQRIGISPSQVASAGIIHGDKVSTAYGKDAGKTVGRADGLIAQEKNLYLSVTTADCLPIFLFEPAKEIVGIVHAGWRSLEKDILANAVEKMEKLGGSPEDILVGIGPAICQKHYEVGPEVAEKFEKYPEAVKEVRPRRIRLRRKSDKVLLDIKRIARLQLTALGLSEKNIDISSDCTFELPQKYFSARRDKKKEVEAMMAVIGIRK